MKDYLKISFCGDIMCLKEQNRAALSRYGAYRYDGYMSSISNLFEDSDYVVANLETPLLPPPFLEKETTNHDVSFSTPASILEEIKRTGIRFLSTANNHCLDRDIQGIEDTVRLIGDVGLDQSGTFITNPGEKKYFIREIDGVRVAIVCSTYGTNSRLNGIMLPADKQWMVNLTRRQEKMRNLKFDPSDSGHSIEKYIPDDVSPAAIDNSKNKIYLEAIADSIRKARKEADIVVAFPHVGGQYNPAPGLYARYIVNSLKEAGADIIVANHPHTSHRCEQMENGVFCAWALGNLAFTPDVGFFLPNTLADYSIILHTYWNRKNYKLERMTFNVTKITVSEEGFASVSEVSELYESLCNKGTKERMMIDNEAVVNRFAGWAKSIVPQREYELYNISQTPNY